MRGQSSDYNEWAKLNPGWSWEEVLPLFRKSLDYAPSKDAVYPIDTEQYKQGGEWRVESQRLGWDVLDDFAKAGELVGIPRVKDFNNSEEIGSGYFQVNQERGLRWSSSEGFLQPIADRSNLHVITGVTVTNINVDADLKCNGISFVDRNGSTTTITAKNETILSAGSIGSPHLLQVSGIGDAGVLKKHNIHTRLNLPGVGHNLQDHLQIRSVYKLKDGTPTLNTLSNSIIGRIRMGFEYILNQSGPLAMAPSQLGMFCKSRQAKTPNMQYHVQPLSLDKFGDPLHSFPGITAAV